jgi:biotin-(acetyl-CoA carboxylase) ligase
LQFSKRFRERCWLNGREVSIASGPGIIQGFCNGIDEEGALLVQTLAGPERILSGTVTAIGEQVVQCLLTQGRAATENKILAGHAALGDCEPARE